MDVERRSAWACGCVLSDPIGGRDRDADRRLPGRTATCAPALTGRTADLRVLRRYSGDTMTASRADEHADGGQTERGPDVPDRVSDPKEPLESGPEPTRGRSARLGARVVALVRAIRDTDDKAIEEAVMRLARSRRIFAPLALAVGAVILLLDGVRLLLSNWR